MSRMKLVILGVALVGAQAYADGGGTANQAWQLYQAGLRLSALEMLTGQTRPSQVETKLLGQWTAELKTSPLVQKGWVPMFHGWDKIVNNSPVSMKLKTPKQIQAAFARADKLPKDQVNARARIWWAIATGTPQQDDVTSALKALTLMEASSQTLIGTDLVASVHGRVLYQKNDIAGAEAQFAKIPKSSSLWVENLEERAWGHLRKDEYDAALGDSITLLSPALAPLVGPESYFLANLLALKVCDYPRLFKTSDLFKLRHRQRLIDLQALVKDGTTPAFEQVLTAFDAGGVGIDAAGPQIVALPRAALRDRFFVRYAEMRRLYLQEAELASGKPEFSQLAASNHAKADQMRVEEQKRARQLAKAELDQYRIILDKLHLIEGEVIERLHLDPNLKGQRSTLSQAEDKGDVLVFPYKTKEVWFDELGNYKAQVKDCPTLKGASL